MRRCRHSTRTVFAFCSPLTLPDQAALERGVSCVTAVDNRWGRCDIKSTALLANILLRDQATQAGAAETILLRDGVLTEGPHRPCTWCCDGELVTPALSAAGAAQPDPRRGGKDGAARRISVRSAPITEAQLRRRLEVMLVGGDPGSDRGDHTRRRPRRHGAAGPGLAVPCTAELQALQAGTRRRPW